jgi:hypothetical protein
MVTNYDIVGYIIVWYDVMGMCLYKGRRIVNVMLHLLHVDSWTYNVLI